MYSSETILWKEKERCRIGAVQMKNLRGLPGIWRTDIVSNARIRELYGVKKGVEEGFMKVFSDGLVMWR